MIVAQHVGRIYPRSAFCGQAIFQYRAAGEGGAAPVVEEPLRETPAGRRRRPLLYRLRYKGKAFVFDDVDSLIAFLNAREREEERRVEARAERDAQRIVKVGEVQAKARPPVVRIESRVPEIVDYISQLQAKIERHYWAKLAQALGAEMEEEEELVILASMLRN